MIRYLRRKFMGNDLEKLDSRLEKAFESIDDDVKRITSWINHLNGKHNELHSSHKEEILIRKKNLDHLSNWVSYLHKHNVNVHRQVQDLQHYTMRLNERMNSFEDKLSELTKTAQDIKIEQKKPQIGNKVELLEIEDFSPSKIGSDQGSIGSVRTEPELRSEPNRHSSPNRTDFEERMLVQHIRPNKKNYVIKEIISTVKSEDLTTKQLERLIVGEKKLCGRTTFYAHLKELKDKKIIENGMIGSKSVLIVTN